MSRDSLLRNLGRFRLALPSPPSSLPGEDFPENDVEESSADDLEEQELLLLTRAEIEAALESGEIKVLAWAAAVAFALRRL